MNETVCVRCHDLCLEGCTGSGVHVGTGGCNRCKEVHFDADFQQVCVYVCVCVRARVCVCASVCKCVIIKLGSVVTTTLNSLSRH